MTTRRQDGFLLWARVAAIPLIATGCRGALIAPPSQPSSGPGGSDYLHAAVTIENFGEGNDEYWIITPEDPLPSTAPVVVFLHGWGGMTPVALNHRKSQRLARVANCYQHFIDGA